MCPLSQGTTDAKLTLKSPSGPAPMPLSYWIVREECHQAGIKPSFFSLRTKHSAQIPTSSPLQDLKLYLAFKDLSYFGTFPCCAESHISSLEVSKHTQRKGERKRGGEGEREEGAARDLSNLRIL